MKRYLIAASLLIACLTVPGIAIAQKKGIPGKFDFYVLALSWSPDYCQSAGNRDPQQCGQGKKLGFVLHGLWPQYNRGYPANCSNETLSESVKQQFPDLFPSAKLYDHEWEKHGTCSGRSPSEYLQLSKQVKNSVNIPSSYKNPYKPFRTTINELKQNFASANSNFNTDSVAPYCSGSGRFLKEVFFCFSTSGQPQACSPEVLKGSQKSCGQPDFLVRSVR
jgi:ribonuclease T2